jgi:type VI secretion system protein ImpK
MDPITELTEATFNAVSQLRRLDGNQVGMPEVLHQQLCTFVEQAARGARKAGMAQEDAEDIRYALVALVDETVLGRGGALRDMWLPRTLQLRFFNENIAGEAFFQRLQKLRGDRNRVPVLRVYYLCLLFGFAGKYKVRGGEVELADLIDEVRAELKRAGELHEGEDLSPRGPRPYESLADSRRNALVWWTCIVAASASVLLYLFLKLSLTHESTQFVERLAAITGL